MPSASLSSASGLEFNYSASVSSFLLSSRSSLTVASSVLLRSFRSSGLSPSSRPGFPCLLSGSAYSAFCLFPFVLPCFAPTAVPQVLPFWNFPRGSTLDFRFLSSASILASHYSALCSSFSTFFPFSPRLWLFRCSFGPFVPQVFPLLSGLVSHAFFPVPCTWLSVCFLSSSFLLRSHSCSTGAHLTLCLTASSQVLPPAVHFLSVLTGLGSDYSASVSSFPFFHILPHSGFLCAFILVPFRLLPCFPFRFGTQLCCNSFRPGPFASQRLPSSVDHRSTLLLPFRSFPLAFALGSVYSAGTTYPEN